MVRLYDLILKEFDGDAFILLQIHDELIFEVKESRLEEFRKRAEDITRRVVSLNVSLDISSSVGKSMAEL